MAVDVRVPGVGESVQEGMIESWQKKSGDWVETDEVLLELETDKATVEVVAEASGVLTISVEEGEVVKVDQVIGKIDTSASKPAGAGSSATDSSSEPEPQVSSLSASSSSGRSAPEGSDGPAVRKMEAESGVKASSVSGTGRDGRVTKGDMQKAIASGGAAKEKPAPKKEVKAPTPAMVGERTDTKKPMSMMRRRIAERLTMAQQEAAILTTFNEVDMTNVMALRSKYKESFQKKYDMKLGFMGFFLKASAAALESFPAINAYIEGNEVIYHNYVDIGVAVSTGKGLVVPVVKNVHAMTIQEIEAGIAVYAGKARDNKISMDDLTGGTFTVSNGGVFGSLLSTPILNPPQSAILGMHKTQQRPMVMEDGSIQARPMMYLALSYDHRIVDGKEAVQFLVKIKEAIEDPARLLLGV